MEMTYDGMLVMPSNYSVMDEEEMTYVDGGIAVESVLGMMAAVGFQYEGCYRVGQRLGYKYTKKQYSKVKWPLRAAVLGVGGTIIGGVAIIGFENGFYSTAH